VNNWRSLDEYAHLNELLHLSCRGVPAPDRLYQRKPASDAVGNAPIDRSVPLLAPSTRRPIVAIPPITRISTLSHSGANLIVALPHTSPFLMLDFLRRRGRQYSNSSRR
jgi:hypothetical protein